MMHTRKICLPLFDKENQVYFKCGAVIGWLIGMVATTLTWLLLIRK